MTQVIAELQNEETRRYHLRKLYELSLKSLGQIPLLDELTEEQEAWVQRRIRNARSWEKWNK